MAFRLTRRIAIPLTLPTLYLLHQPRLRCQTAPYLTDRVLEARQEDSRFKIKRRYIEEPDNIKRGTGIFDINQYRQLSLGSFGGVVAGYVVGRLSRVIAFVGLLIILVVQYLERHDYQVLPRPYRLRKYLEETDLKPLLTKNAAFKYSFASTFAISAWFAN
ncbi:hypothetical protein TWF481_005362 [Arthrobotrys musiformis]|uniref:FUN14 n=1 Tax=Arthrobotrys musiformis TaxID=47236 RepID=A0AAV9WFJ7_9PEZI